MYTISVETSFTSSHQLTLPDGSKEPLHSHDWIVTAEVAGEQLDAMGIVMDFHKLKAMINAITAVFADKQLDDFDYFKINTSSAETLARYIFESLEPLLGGTVNLTGITVVEEPLCRARYSK